MSLPQTMSAKLMEVQMNAFSASGIDPCLVEDATGGVTDALLANVTNFMYGTGLTIVVIMFIIGLLMFVFGRGEWVAKAGIGIIILVFLPAILQLINGMVTGGGC